MQAKSNAKITTQSPMIV